MWCPRRPRSPLTRVLLLPVALAAVATAPPSASAAGYACGDQDVGRTRCTRVVVPQDRAAAIPGEVGLSVRTVQLGQERKKVRREAVVFLAGGPGQAATSLAADVAPLLRPLLRKRDLVAVDTRGTGRSTDLIVCPELETSAITGLSPFSLITSCGRRLGSAIDRYGTTDVVADLEAVRVAGGYEKLLLVGVSYGTYTAQRYAAAHPDRVSGLVLDSVVDVDRADPFSLATYRALPGVLENACGRGACNGVTGDVRRDLERTRARLPLRATVDDDATGRRRPVTLGAQDLIGLIQAGDLTPWLRSALPAALRRAGEGDPFPLVRLADQQGAFQLPGDDADPSSVGSAASISAGSLVATTCRDTTQPWAPGTPQGEPRRVAALAALAARSDAERGGWRPEDLFDLTPAGLCAAWPGEAERAPVAPAPDVPTLLLSGDDDTRTSPEEARQVAERRPGATLLRVPGAGHSLLGSGRGCIAPALQAFADGKPVGGCRLPKVRRAAALTPASPAQFGRTGTARAKGVARAAVLDAYRTAMTSQELIAALVVEGLTEQRREEDIRLPGLRSGTLTVDPKIRFRLDRLGVTPGTTVSTGLIGGAATIRVRVAGKGLRPGRYTIPNPLRDAAAVAALGLPPIEELLTLG